MGALSLLMAAGLGARACRVEGRGITLVPHLHSPGAHAVVTLPPHSFHWVFAPKKDGAGVCKLSGTCSLPCISADQILQTMEANDCSTFTCPSAKPSHLQCTEHHVLTRCSPAGSSPLLPALLAQLGTSPGSHAGFGHKKKISHEAMDPAWEQGNPGAGLEQSYASSWSKHHSPVLPWRASSVSGHPALRDTWI